MAMGAFDFSLARAGPAAGLRPQEVALLRFGTAGHGLLSWSSALVLGISAGSVGVGVVLWP